MLINSPNVLASFIRDQRKQQHLSQMAVSDKVGLKQTTLSKLEIDAKGTKLDTLFRILAALDLEMHLIKKCAEQQLTAKWTEEW